MAARAPTPGRSFRVVLGILAVALNLAVVYAPQAPTVDTGGLPVDKVIHAVVFALPVIALVAAGLPLAPVAALMALHAPVSELVQQHLLPDRSGDPLDVAADLLGVAIGVLVAHRLLVPRRAAS